MGCRCSRVWRRRWPRRPCDPAAPPRRPAFSLPFALTSGALSGPPRMTQTSAPTPGLLAPERARQLAAEYGLKPDEYDRILAILGREPSLTELGIFSVMWSEHCSYKS